MATKKKSLQSTLKENRTNDFKKEALDAKKLFASGDYKQVLGTSPLTKNIDPRNADVIATVAKKASDDEWLEFMKTHELPPVKLSAQEMELFSGGGWFADTAESVVDLVYDMHDYEYYQTKK